MPERRSADSMLAAALVLAVLAAPALAQTSNTFPCPCMNSGQCLRIAGTTRTMCYCNQNPGYGKTYRGDRCQAESEECGGGNFCVNGGRCVHYQGETAVFCQCPAGTRTTRSGLHQRMHYHNGGLHCQYVQPPSVKTKSVQKLSGPVVDVSPSPQAQASAPETEKEAAAALADAAAPDSVDTLPNDGTAADIADAASGAEAPASEFTTTTELVTTTVYRTPAWHVALLVLFGVGLVGLAGVLAVMVARERRGRPLFGSAGPSGFAGFSDSKANPLSHQGAFQAHGTQDRIARLEAIVSEIASSFGGQTEDSAKAQF